MTSSIRFAGWRWNRPLAALLVLVLAVAVALTLRAAPSSAPLAPDAVPAGATAAAKAPTLAGLPASRPVSVIVAVRGTGTAADAAALVAAHGATAGTPLEIIHAVAATMTAGQARALAAEPEIRAISLDAAVRSTGYHRFDRRAIESDYLKAVRASRAWDRNDNATGAGVGVAVIDTGIAGDLPDFRVSADDATSRVVASAVENAGTSTAADTLGHGTHVAGLIAGNGSALDDDDPALGKHYGVAPDANLIAVKIADDQGSTTLADVIAGLQFVLDHQADLNIKVVNLSLNSTVAQSRDTDPLDAAVEVAWLNGITVVAAAGNRGSAPDAVGYAPANDPYVISVGATDDSGTPKAKDDVVPDWSSRGTTQDGFAKPEVLAPGAHMIAPLAPGSAYGTQCPECVVDGRYLQIGGTSMAAGVVSGAAADLLSAHPDWTPDQVKFALIKKSRHVSNSDVGEIDVAAAVKANGNKVGNKDLRPSALLPSYDPAAADFDRLSWTRLSWTRLSWTRLSWTSVDGGDAKGAPWSRLSWTCACVPPEDADGDGQVDPSRLSWTRLSWTRLSWTASFSK